jgi:hypothetical protein
MASEAAPQLRLPGGPGLHPALLAQRFDLVNLHATFLISVLGSRSAKRKKQHGSSGWTRWHRQRRCACRRARRADGCDNDIEHNRRGGFAGSNL